jgi:hypothetical protein
VTICVGGIAKFGGLAVALTSDPAVYCPFWATIEDAGGRRNDNGRHRKWEARLSHVVEKRSSGGRELSTC